VKVPCVTIRDNTERPETVEVGANVVAGVEPEGIVKAAVEMIDRKRDWKQPFGDGHAAERIGKILENKLG
jgi:UDP-N-acetylglucosamine 2-epimerase (non-hydrolysing)